MNVEIERQFLEAYDSWSDAIYRHCVFRLYSHVKAEDFMQETFLRVWRYLSEGHQIENLRAFLYKVANHLIIDDSRKKKDQSLEQLMEAKSIAEPTVRNDTEIERNILIEQIRERMSDLSHEYQEILTLRYLDDLSPVEIAKIVGSNANAVSVKLNRAVKALKTHFPI